MSPGRQGRRFVWGMIAHSDLLHWNIEVALSAMVEADMAREFLSPDLGIPGIGRRLFTQ